MPPSIASLSPAAGYTEVRGLARGLHVLRALNSLPGCMGGTTEIASLCKLHRTTVKRLLETLRVEGLVRQGEREGQYCLTFEVRRLNEGFVDEAWVSKVATNSMRDSVKTLLWPCDIATMEAGFMIVRESTHRWSGLSQHRAMIGEKMPLFVTALGRAYLGACEADERSAILHLLAQREDWIGEFARDEARVSELVAETVRRGYAVNSGELPRDVHYSAIAIPVFCGSRLLAALNMVFPKGAVQTAEVETRYLPALRQLASTIGKLSQSWVDA